MHCNGLVQVCNPYLTKDSQFFLQPKAGIRLPPDRHCLTATNYKLKARYFKTLSWKSDIFFWSQTSALWLWLRGRGRRWPEATVQQEQTRWLRGKALGALVKQPNMHSQEEQRQLWRTRTASVWWATRWSRVEKQERSLASRRLCTESKFVQFR